MTWFDLLVLGVAALAAVGGYRLGLLTRVLSWVGLAAGLVLAIKALPLVLDHVDPAKPALVVAVTVGVALVGASVGQALGFVVGRHLRPVPARGALGALDGAAGAAAGVVGVVAVVWLVLPVLGGLPGGLSREVSRSWVSAQVVEHLPPPPDAVDALHALVGDDRFPEVFAALQPTPELGPPPVASGLSPEVAAQVARSVVKVEGVACRRIQTGTGFAVADGLVVTNAHVIAGAPAIDLVRDDGTRVAAVPVAFDPTRDLAVLSAPDLDRPALAVGGSAVGQRGGVFGHPLGQPLRIAPFEVGRITAATGRDIYGAGLTERQVLELAAALQHGDSGSPLVGPDGAVVGVTFAVSPERPELAYALSTDELRAALAAPLGAAVGTGPCLG